MEFMARSCDITFEWLCKNKLARDNGSLFCLELVKSASSGEQIHVRSSVPFGLLSQRKIRDGLRSKKKKVLHLFVLLVNHKIADEYTNLVRHAP